MNMPAHIGRSREQAFMLVDDPDLAALSLTIRVGVTPAKNVGDVQNPRGAFIPVGGAIAANKSPQTFYGGADGVTNAVLLAEYDAQTRQVFELTDLGTRNARTVPWDVGKNISLLCDPTKSSKGFVMRGSKMGDAGFDAHVYIAGTPGDGPLILHHDTPNAPVNSTRGFEGDLSRPALVSDALRIGAGIDNLCNVDPKYKVGVAPGRDWVFFNGTKHGGARFSGYLATRFAASDAFLSYEVGGPLRDASSLHDFAYTYDKRWMRRAALSIAQHLWTNGNPDFDAPMWIEEVDEPPVQEPEGHPMRVHCQFDPKDTHAHPCAPGTRKKKIKWHKKEPIVETPPCKGATTPSSTRPVTGAAYGAKTLMMAGFAPLSDPRA